MKMTLVVHKYYVKFPEDLLKSQYVVTIQDR